MIRCFNLILSFLLCNLVLLSCADKIKTSNSEISVVNDTITFAAKYVDPESVVQNFYKWYLSSIYLKKSVEAPEVILTKDSVYELDASKHLEFLSECGYFSSKFYENEIQLFKKCDEQLKKVDVKQVEESGGLALDFVGNEDCSFMNWKAWTGGQGEILNTVKIASSYINDKLANVVVAIGDSTGFVYSTPNVTLIKEDREWKISKIVITKTE